MVSPITPYSRTFGPFTDKYGSVYYRTEEGYRQRPPFTVDTTYIMACYRRLSGWLPADSVVYTPPPLGGTYPPKVDRMYRGLKNKVYEEVMGKLGEKSSFGATLTAELRETWGMLTNTTLRILRAARNVKRLRFRAAARDLGLSYREVVRVERKRVRRTGRNGRRFNRWVYRRTTYMKFGSYREIEKSLAGGWLMWSYGVKPLAEDLYNAMDHWGGELPQGERFSARASDRAAHVVSPGNPYVVDVFELGVSCVAYVRVNNADLWNANKLGLVNPAQWVVEAIPFSFVADWFSNLSQVIMSFTDMLGLDVHAVLSEKHHQVWSETWTPGGSSVRSQFWFLRFVGLPTPTLVIDWERFSWQRGLNAISLLIGFKP